MTASNNRHISIDGLRGYLALSVFLHHSILWYQYVRTSLWKKTDVHFFNNLGQSSVALFFMITAFLFLNKISQIQGSNKDWLKLYVARFFRIVPLYWFTVLIICVIALLKSYFGISFSSLWPWLLFTFPGVPDLALIDKTWLMVAGVIWSLCYEWIFYFTLPALTLFYDQKKNTLILFVFFPLVIYLFFLFPFDYRCFRSFLGGVMAVFLLKNMRFVEFAKTKKADWIALILLLLNYFFSPSGFSLISTLVLGFVFSIFASGNTFFGLLKHKFSIFLGELSYGIYLLHGIFLYVLFRYWIGMNTAREMSVVSHLMHVMAMIPLLIGVAYLANRYIEIPFIHLGRKINKKL